MTMPAFTREAASEGPAAVGAAAQTGRYTKKVSRSFQVALLRLILEAKYDHFVVIALDIVHVQWSLTYCGLMNPEGVARQGQAANAAQR